MPVASKTRIPAGTPITVSSKVKVTCSGAVSSTAPCAGSDPMSVAWAAAGDAGTTSSKAPRQASSSQAAAQVRAMRTPRARWVMTALTQPADRAVVTHDTWWQSDLLIEALPSARTHPC
ncbi:hypothetical protein GCM10009641_30120 [Mycobacterium cookii]|uniref:Ig-like domain-containing protein n=1 Tax=Nocardioides furvisabuli TaxID=375542 RepID=A0ABN2XMM4_9ACTN